MKLMISICEVSPDDVMSVYDARSGHPVPVIDISASGDTSHVLPIGPDDCIVIVPREAMLVTAEMRRPRLWWMRRQ